MATQILVGKEFGTNLELKFTAVLTFANIETLKNSQKDEKKKRFNPVVNFAFQTLIRFLKINALTKLYEVETDTEGTYYLDAGNGVYKPIFKFFYV